MKTLKMNRSSGSIFIDEDDQPLAVLIGGCGVQVEEKAEIIIAACNSYDQLRQKIAEQGALITKLRDLLAAQTARIEAFENDIYSARMDQEQLMNALELAKEALLHSAPKANQYEEPKRRHANAIIAVNLATAQKVEGDGAKVGGKAIMGQLVAALKLAQTALLHSEPSLTHYPEPVKRHADAEQAVKAALAAAGAA